VDEPENNEAYLSRFFTDHHDIPGVVVMNSRGNYVANYLYNNHIEDVKMVCLDLTTPNVEALKRGQIDYLIGQEPEHQGFPRDENHAGTPYIQETGQAGELRPTRHPYARKHRFYKRFNNII